MMDKKVLIFGALIFSVPVFGMRLTTTKVVQNPQQIADKRYYALINDAHHRQIANLASKEKFADSLKQFVHDQEDLERIEKNVQQYLDTWQRYESPETFCFKNLKDDIKLGVGGSLACLFFGIGAKGVIGGAQKVLRMGGAIDDHSGPNDSIGNLLVMPIEWIGDAGVLIGSGGTFLCGSAYAATLLLQKLSQHKDRHDTGIKIAQKNLEHVKDLLEKYKFEKAYSKD